MIFILIHVGCDAENTCPKFLSVLLYFKLARFVLTIFGTAFAIPALTASIRSERARPDRFLQCSLRWSGEIRHLYFCPCFQISAYHIRHFDFFSLALHCSVLSVSANLKINFYLFCTDFLSLRSVVITSLKLCRFWISSVYVCQLNTLPIFHQYSANVFSLISFRQ